MRTITEDSAYKAIELRLKKNTKKLHFTTHVISKIRLKIKKKNHQITLPLFNTRVNTQIPKG